jgi:hypothetical protein
MLATRLERLSTISSLVGLTGATCAAMRCDLRAKVIWLGTTPRGGTASSPPSLTVRSLSLAAVLTPASASSFLLGEKQHAHIKAT